MATRLFTADDETVAAGRPVEHQQAVGRLHRHQLTVVASTMADVVQSAGGWLFDCGRAGWDVRVLVARGDDPRPLAILGATAWDPDTDVSAMVRKVAQGGALAVGADLLGTDARVRDEVLRLLKQGCTEVTLWGDAWPAELGRQAEPVQQRMSAAARAFKCYALAAAAVSDDSVTRTETLVRIGAGAFRPLYSV